MLCQLTKLRKCLKFLMNTRQKLEPSMDNKFLTLYAKPAGAKIQLHRIIALWTWP